MMYVAAPTMSPPICCQVIRGSRNRVASATATSTTAAWKSRTMTTATARSPATSPRNRLGLCSGRRLGSAVALLPACACRSTSASWWRAMILPFDGRAS